MRKNKIYKQLREDAGRFGPALIIGALYCFILSVFLGTCCPSAVIFGLPCPGCGLTRSLVYLLTGRWSMAWEMNPMIFPLGGVFIYFMVNRYILFRKAKRIREIFVLIMISMIILYVVRMILYFPNREPYCYKPGNLMERITLGFYPFWDM